ncbi:hypothetical protein GCM10023318_30450 [Nocardia callitridis]|uniref:AMP-dependent synthetase/ligase domain-containing protein n=1 Tax=Nocardia callitridis TaxID=648753 RepID=A0ABP9KDF5_9NOCA
MIGVQNSGAIVVPVDASAPERRRETIASDCAARFAIGPDVVGSDIVRDLFPATGNETDVTPHAGSLMIYTSGSSGKPKGILCPRSAIEFAVDAIQSCLRYRPTDTIAQPLPLTFDYGLYQVLLAMRSGARVRMYPDGSTGPTFLGRLERDEVTVLPTMPVLSDALIRVSTRRHRTLGGIRLITSTGGACSKDQLAGLRRLAPDAQVLPMYGLTECKRATITTLGARGDELGAGRPLPGTQIRIGSDETPSRGSSGEIHVGGPHVMAGYWPLHDRTLNRAFRTDSRGVPWVATGDTGRIDTEGVLHVEGRLDDIFKANGFRTSTSEVESALMAVEGVTHACVLAPSNNGAFAAAFVGSVAEHEVRTRLGDHLEAAKHPPTLIKLAAMPVNGNGKVDRNVVAHHIIDKGQA